MQNCKKERSSNFTANEISKLLQIVKGYRKIVECKKTDSTTWKEKDDCWDKISAELNAQCGENFRSQKSIKSKYDDLKKNLKKKLAKNKAETFMTGGGVPKIEMLTASEEMLLSLLDPSQTHGLPSFFDSDMIEEDNMNLTDGTAEKTLAAAITDTSDTENWQMEMLDCGINEDSLFDQSQRTPSAEISMNLHEPSIASVRSNKRPFPDVLQNQKHKARASKGVAVFKANVSRELRTYPKVSSRIETITQLAKSKEELVRMQISVLKQDMKIKAETDDLQKKILQTELEMKKNQVFAELEINAAQLNSIELDIKMKKKALTMED